MATRETEASDLRPGERSERRWSWGPAFRMWEVLAFAAIALAYAALALDAILAGPPLGHDEAVYALRTRAFVENSTGIQWFWGDHRAPGLPWLLQIVFLAGETAPYLRLGVAAMTGMAVVLTWLVGRYLLTPRLGLLAAGGLAVTPLWVVIGSQVWPDGPGAAVGLAAIAALLFGTSGERASWWVVVAVPLTVLATVIRYGAPITIGVAGLAILGWRRHHLRTSKPQIATVAVGAAVPSFALVFTELITERRSPYEATSRFVDANAPSIVDGWIGYAKAVPDLLGDPAVIAMVLGLAVLVVSATAHRAGVRLSATIAFLTFAVLATTLPAETRYLAPVLPWLWIAASAGIAVIAMPLARKTVVAGGLVVLLVLGIAAVVSNDEINDAAKQRFGVLKEAAGDFDWGDGCVVATTYNAQVGWYSGCRTVNLGQDDEPPIDDLATHVLWVENGKRQTDEFNAWRDDAAPPTATYGTEGAGSLQLVEIYELLR